MKILLFAGLLLVVHGIGPWPCRLALARRRVLKQGT